MKGLEPSSFCMARKRGPAPVGDSSRQSVYSSRIPQCPRGHDTTASDPQGCDRRRLGGLGNRRRARRAGCGASDWRRAAPATTSELSGGIRRRPGTIDAAARGRAPDWRDPNRVMNAEIREAYSRGPPRDVRRVGDDRRHVGRPPGAGAADTHARRHQRQARARTSSFACWRCAAIASLDAVPYDPNRPCHSSR
jgi:hypothetical protein